MTQNLPYGKPVILRDKREKIPWTFDFYNDVDVIDYSLKTADYSLKGFEDSFGIERKRSTNEISINLGIKKKQFEAELERFSHFRFAYVICEFPMSYLDTFPVNSGIPESRWKSIRINKNYMKMQIGRMSAKYQIEFIFCKDPQHAENVAYETIMRCWNRLNG